jgi:hypothetical protein
MSDASSIPWWQVATILLGNGLVTYAVTWWREAGREKRSQDRDGRYIALRLVAVLERFARECADVIYDNKNADPHDEYDPNNRGVYKLPELGQYPTDADWKALDPLLASRAFSLPTEIDLTKDQIRFWWDVVGDEYAMLTEASEQAGKCGYRAWMLATELRSRYQLPASHLLEVTIAWADALKENHDQAMVRVAERKAEAAEEARAKAATQKVPTV